ncbi:MULTISPECIES: hypothetical protein [Rhodococcus]|uniref:Uncharacterized protein n=2 Tax=Rhodococcus TaxID=1827 RepID=A0ABU4CBI7_RHOJO|nr:MULTISPECIES: hypothetical protein [Rhodococcus]MDH6288627.1 hypothetical protein [Rhodococcus opacus]MDI9954127.1 hypothetical protein [Rhodococcus sp. IEGM 1305]MDV6280788.1 hypothetical protein [Rhodococcus jostii]
MIDAQTLSGPIDIAAIRNVRRWSPGACVWCGDDNAVEMFRNEPRCGTCREKESVIDEARRFLGMYGLRPLGGTLQSDDDEEREHRVNARDARRELNEMKLAELPDPAAVRKALRPRAASVVSEPRSTAHSGTSSAAASTRPSASRTSATPPVAPVRTDVVDVAALESRVTGLLDQLSAIDAQMNLIGEPAGLAARARISDLEKQRATVLRTLAALEKARIAAGQ